MSGSIYAAADHSISGFAHAPYMVSMNKNIDAELPVWPDESEEEKDDNLPCSVVEVVSVHDIDETTHGDGNILSRRYVAAVDGIEPFWCYEVWEDGKLRSRSFNEYDIPNKVVCDPYIPVVETWFANGQLQLVAYRPSRRQIKKHFRGGCAEDEPLVTRKDYFEDGTLFGIDYWRLNEEGELRETRKSFYENGGKKLFLERNYGGEYDSIGNEPAFVTYYENGQVMIQEWYKDGKYHREGGPAVIEYTEDGRVIAEKYFLEGVEVPGTASLFGYAK